MEDLLNALILPKEVVAEELSEVITACILRKAYLSTSSWSKWILLAALDILLGNPVPIPNEELMKIIQDNASSVKGQSNKEGIKFVHNPLQEQGLMKFWKDDNVKENVNLLNVNIAKENLNVLSVDNVKEDVTLPSVDNAKENFNLQNIDSAKANVDLLSVDNRKENIDLLNDEYVEENFELPVTSFEHVKKNVNLPSAHNVKDVNILSKPILYSESATYDASIQTDFEDFLSKMSKDVGIQCVPEDTDLSLKEQTATAQRSHKFAHIVETSESESGDHKQATFMSDDQTLYRLRKISGLKRCSNLKPPPRYSCLPGGKIIRMFYSRPLIRSSSKLPAPIIPLEPVVNLNVFDCTLDPRHSSSLSNIEFVDDESLPRSKDFASTPLKKEVAHNSASGFATELNGRDSTSADVEALSMILEEEFTVGGVQDMELEISSEE